MKISGHKDRGVFDRYNITSESDLKAAAEMLSKYVQSAVLRVVGPKLDQME
jgi:hypothetical protein